MQKIDLSIIIPIYNVEKYIFEFLNSIKLQSTPQIEFIFVDDGSTDSSIEILEENLHYFNNYKLIRKKNGGVSSARNVGLKQCNGTYITFIDPDDCVNSDYILTILNNLGYDLLMYDYYRFNSHTKEKNTLDISEGIYDKNEILKIFIPNLYGIESLPFSFNIFPMVWNKVYKLDIIKGNNLHFMSQREVNSEDSLFNIEYLSKCENVKYIKKTIINYRANNNSLTMKPKNIQFYLARDKLLKIYKHYSIKFENNVSRVYHTRILFEYIQWFQFCFFNKNSYFENKEMFENIYDKSFLKNECNVALKKINDLKINKLYKFYLFFLSHKIYFVCYLIQYSKKQIGRKL